MRTLLIIVCVTALGCARTIAPTPVVSHAASLDTKGNPTSGILHFYATTIQVDEHWMARYRMMYQLNSQKPDFVNGKINPDKVFIAGKEEIGVVLQPDGTYRVPYYVLSYFDRLNENLNANRKL